MPAAIVANGSADIFGNAVDVAQQVLDTLFAEFRMLLDGGVQIIHIGGMMLIMVQRHGLRVDVRLQRGIVVRKRRK